MVNAVKKSLHDYIYILSQKLKGKASLTNMITSGKKNRTKNLSKIKSKKGNYTLDKYYKDCH